MNLKEFQALDPKVALASTFGARVYTTGDLSKVKIVSVTEARKITPILIPAKQ